MKLERVKQLHSYCVRLGAADYNGYVQCVTCSAKHHWKYMDCGHYINRRNMSAYFHPLNCYPQCRECNRFHDGRKKLMELHIIRTHGEEELEELLRLSVESKVYTSHELDCMGKEYLKRYNDLLKQVVA